VVARPFRNRSCRLSWPQLQCREVAKKRISLSVTAVPLAASASLPLGSALAAPRDQPSKKSKRSFGLFYMFFCTFTPGVVQSSADRCSCDSTRSIDEIAEILIPVHDDPSTRQDCSTLVFFPSLGKFPRRFLNARFLPLGRPRTSILETLRSREESRSVENLAVITLSILI